MQRGLPILILAVAILIVVGVALLPRPWNDVGGLILMLGLFVFVTVQERRTGRPAGLIKWLALALAAWDAYRLYLALS